MGAMIMKYMVGGLIVLVLIIGYFINKSNKEDQERIKQTQISQQQRLEQNKLDEAQSQKRLELQKQEFENKKKMDVSNSSNQIAPVNSDAPKHKYSEEEWLSICKSTAGGAKSIMSSRQRGVSMTEMMDKVVGSADPAIRDIIKAFVIDAYSRPRYDTPEVQQKEILDFENNAYVTCIKVRQ